MSQAKGERQPRHLWVPTLPRDAELKEISGDAQGANRIDWDCVCHCGWVSPPGGVCSPGSAWRIGLETYLTPGRQRYGPRARTPLGPRSVRRRLSSNPDGAGMRSGLYTSALFLQHYFTARKKEGGGGGKTGHPRLVYYLMNKNQSFDGGGGS